MAQTRISDSMTSPEQAVKVLELRIFLHLHSVYRRILCPHCVEIEGGQCLSKHRSGGWICYGMVQNDRAKRSCSRPGTRKALLHARL